MKDGKLVVPYQDSAGRIINLLTPDELGLLPEGTVLGCINGKTVVKGKDEIDMDTRYGRLAYGTFTDLKDIMANMKPIMIECRLCKVPKKVSCTLEQYGAWRNGALIQDAMPNVPKDERELLISGTCGACFDKLFPSEDDMDL
jgi:hypothetical protein